MGNKDINRLKVVLAEKNEQINGLQNRWVKILQRLANGAPIPHSQTLRR